ncbi:MAG: transposase family protein [Deltaproteobacteria bacterium]|nr:transposase family protein [Deltaproteobacteria bacterium]
MSPSQGDLFPSKRPAIADAASLLLVARPDRPLTPAQRSFNRLVARVEKLRDKLQRETRRLDSAFRAFRESAQDIPF